MINKVGVDAGTSIVTGGGIAFPTGIQAGHMMILCVANSSGTSGVPTTPAGWTLAGQVTNTTTLGMWVYRKIAVGTESGGSLFVTYPGGAQAVLTMHVRSGTTPTVNNVLTNSSVASSAVIASQQQTGVPLNGWCMSFSAINASGDVCTISGTNWSQSGNTGAVNCSNSVGDNGTDSGTANICTHTYVTGTTSRVALSLYLAPLAGGGLFFGSL